MRFSLLAAAATIVALPLTAMAQDDDAVAGALKARQGYFTMMASNMGVLGAMAKGDMEYDADAALKAAKQIEALGQYDVTAHFIEGSSRDDLGADHTAAKADIWSKQDDFAQKFAALSEATNGISEQVGDQAAIGPVLGQLGGTCKACHDAYRSN